MSLDEAFKKLEKEFEGLNITDFKEDFSREIEMYTELKRRFEKATEACKTFVNKVWDYRREGINVSKYEDMERRTEVYIEYGEWTISQISKIIIILEELEKREKSIKPS